MARFLQGIRGRYGTSDTATSHATAGSTGAIAGMYGSVFSSGTAGWDVERAVAEGLERVIWVYRCCDAIASNQAKLPVNARQGNRYKGTILNNPTIHKLLNVRSNDYENSFMLRYRCSVNLLLSKRGLFLEKVRNNAGEVVELHVLPSHRTEPIPHPDTFISGYNLHSVNGGVRELSKDKVIWIRLKPHPTDPYLQLTPMMAAGLAADTDYLARLFNRNFLLNDGRPGMLINVNKVNRIDAEELKVRFGGGPYGAGRTTVLESEGIQVMDLGANPRDLQWLEAINGSKDDILLAFGTPESVLGNASGRTFDNADAEKENWWEETEQPHCDGFFSGLDELTGSVTDDIFVAADYQTVDVLQRRERARHAKALEELRSGVITIDDYREVTGRSRWEVPGTRSLFLPTGVIISKDDEDQEAVANLPVVGVAQQGQISAGQQPQYGIGGSDIAKFTNTIAARANALAIGSKSHSLDDGYRSRRYQQKQIEGEAVDSEGVLVGEVMASNGASNPYGDDKRFAEEMLLMNFGWWSKSQEDIVVGRLMNAHARRHTRHWEGGSGTKMLPEDYIVQTDRWLSDLLPRVNRSMERIAEKQIRQTAADMRASGTLRVMAARGLGSPQDRNHLIQVYGSTPNYEQALYRLLRPLQLQVEDAARRQSEHVKDVIRQLERDGATLTQIRAAIKNRIGTRSSWQQGLSRWLSGALIEGAQALTYAQAGDLMDKTWLTADDEHVRPSHAKTDGKVRNILRPFSVGGARLMYPCDPTGPVEETINCRCHLEYTIAKKWEGFYDDHAY